MKRTLAAILVSSLLVSLVLGGGHHDHGHGHGHGHGKVSYVVKHEQKVVHTPKIMHVKKVISVPKKVYVRKTIMSPKVIPIVTYGGHDHGHGHGHGGQVKVINLGHGDHY